MYNSISSSIKPLTLVLHKHILKLVCENVVTRVVCNDVVIQVHKMFCNCYVDNIYEPEGKT